MKNNILIIAAALVLIITSCATVKTNNEMQDANDIYSNKWRLLEINGKSVAEKINDKEPYMAFDKEQNLYTANAGCNTMSGILTIKNNGSIKFGNGISTMMACPDMEIESSLSKMFPKVKKHKITDNILTLLDGKTVLAKFEAKANKTAQIAGQWELDYIHSPNNKMEDLYPSKKPTIRFDEAASRISGNTSCNNYFATYKIDGNNLNFSAIGSTKMMCQGNGEAVYLELLEKVNRFAVSGETLNLLVGDMAMIRFKKVK